MNIRIVASVLFGLAIACANGPDGGAGTGAGGTTAPGGSGGGSPGGAGGSGDWNPAGGSGGSGGVGGSGNAGGVGASGGSGGEQACRLDELPACGTTGPGILLDLRESWGLFIVGSGGVPEIDLPGTVGSHEPGDGEGERWLVIEGLDGVRATLRYTSDPAVAVPVSVGNEVSFHFNAFYDSIAERQAHRQMIWLQDLAGRFLWGADVHMNSTLPPQLFGLSIVSSQMRCAEEIETVYGEEVYGGLDLSVRYRGGVATSAPLGEVTAVSGGGYSGNLQVGAFYIQPYECHDAEHPRMSAQFAFAATELPPAGAGCVLDADCGEDEYCERTAGTCDRIGQCVPRPTWCAVGLPVCACDGQLYASNCAANRAGVDVARGAPACEGHYACGLFACEEGTEACVRGLRQAFAQCLPLSLFCEAGDCSCVDGRGIWEGCSCTEPAPGRYEVTCGGPG